MREKKRERDREIERLKERRSRSSMREWKRKVERERERERLAVQPHTGHSFKTCSPTDPPKPWSHLTSPDRPTSPPSFLSSTCAAGCPVYKTDWGSRMRVMHAPSRLTDCTARFPISPTRAGQEGSYDRSIPIAWRPPIEKIAQYRI